MSRIAQPTRPGIGSHQFFDLAGKTALSLPATTQTGMDFVGTLWPLLPDYSYKFYNAYLNVAASVAQLVKVSSLLIGIVLTDAGGNLVGKLGVAAANFSDPTWAQLVNGASLVATGDPLAEFFSNLNVTGATPGAVAFGTPAFFQIFYAADLFNSDSSSHTANGVGSCVFSALPRL